MQLKIFTVYDSKAEAYLSPFHEKATGSAIRSFETAVNDPQSSFNKFPADFTLFEIGAFDELTGRVTSLTANLNLGNAVAFLKTPDHTKWNKPDPKSPLESLK
jgi:hypothetical protein